MTASETPEEYEARLTKQRERYTQMIASETPEEYKVRLIQIQQMYLPSELISQETEYILYTRKPYSFQLSTITGRLK
ncbi:hypothetical protein ABMA27_010345 [Loxostege sticticalis]|uniref:Uncharacterized protein n=1 Tax=Loxostege sticticalis TaxID=481309 RepID=A0ABR3H5F3_LOXSC